MPKLSYHKISQMMIRILKNLKEQKNVLQKECLSLIIIKTACLRRKSY